MMTAPFISLTVPGISLRFELRRQNLQLKTWGIRKKANTSNSKSLDSSEIHFKVKMTTHLKKLKESYCQRQVRELLIITLQKNWEWRKKM
ncbi:small ubiquitin-related modifier 1 isoform X5 [Tenrec ecaudatus]|uniref:small ubiquitin-related modifier 1 isoform X5 n=1 Tax=Tenrec ecaudatus TaxID=94439 RepID=UPI003F5A54B3